MPRALLSVSDKAGLTGFARGLQRLGFELYATGNTLKAITDGAIDARPVTELTGFPELMDGRVKTLHPAVHAALLARRDKPEHMEALEGLGIVPIDLVCSNLYPFVETVSRPLVKFEDAVEQALRSGVTKTGATVHLVTEDLDAGPILAQESVSVLKDDTVETLRRRIHEAEYRILPAAIRLLEARLAESPAIGQ